MTKESKVKCHLILIASLGGEAENIVKEMPNGFVHLCYDTADLPRIMQQVLLESIGADV